MREVYRILDANFNRAREALRVVEDCGRFALNDPAVTAMAKNLRSNVKEVLDHMPVEAMLTSRDTPGDLGTEITSPTEPRRQDMGDVVVAACKRLTEALRTIEEYSKFVNPEVTLELERMRYNAYTLEQRVVGRLYTDQRLLAMRVYVLMTSTLCPGSLRDTARAAIAGGADALQLREKDIPDAAFLAMAAELRELTDETGRMLIINDRPDIAAIVGADGVHLGQQDLPIAEARKLLRPGAVVGRSTHSLAQAKAAIAEGADYIAVGPIFATETKDAGPIRGVELLREVAELTQRPVVAIGGVGPENVEQIAHAGCKCAAVCGSVLRAEDPKSSVQQMRGVLDR